MSEQHVCIKKDIIDNIVKRVDTLDLHDRENYGSNKELAQAITNIGDTLIKVNESLVTLYNKSDNTNTKIDNLEHKVNAKIDDLEDQINNQKIEDVKQMADLAIKDIKNNSLDLVPIKNKILYALLGLGILYITLDKTGVISKIFGI